MFGQTANKSFGILSVGILSTHPTKITMVILMRINTTAMTMTLAKTLMMSTMTMTLVKTLMMSTMTVTLAMRLMMSTMTMMEEQAVIRSWQPDPVPRSLFPRFSLFYCEPSIPFPAFLLSSRSWSCN